ncbi:hypothetical protein D9M71_705000 [compost metagenome]
MADDRDHLGGVHHLVRSGDRLLRLTSIIAFDQDDLLSVYTALGIDVFCGLLCATPELFAESGVGAGEWGADTNLDIGHGGHRECHGNSGGKGD